MATSPNAAPAAAVAQPAPALPTNAIIEAMLAMGKNVSDLILSPGRPPQVELSGKLVPVTINGGSALSPADTARITGDLFGPEQDGTRAVEE